MRYLAAFIFSLFISSAALAENFDIGDRQISVLPPQGYCALDRNKPNDQTYMRAIQKDVGESGLLLMAFFRCDLLALARQGNGGPMYDGGDVVLTMEGGKPPIFRMTRKDRVIVINRDAAKFDYKSLFAADGRLLSLPLSSSGQAAAYRGAIQADDQGFYWGTVSKRFASEGTVSLVGVSAVTLLKQAEVTIRRLRPEAHRDVMTALLAEQNAYVARLIALNGG